MRRAFLFIRDRKEKREERREEKGGRGGKRRGVETDVFIGLHARLEVCACDDLRGTIFA